MTLELQYILIFYKINKNLHNYYFHDHQHVERCLHDFPPLEVTEQYRKLWSLSNRRLFVARLLKHIGWVHQVGIMLYPISHPRVQRVKDGRTKFESSYSTKNGDIQVLVKSFWAWERSPREWWGLGRRQDDSLWCHLGRLGSRKDDSFWSHLGRASPPQRIRV